MPDLAILLADGTRTSKEASRDCLVDDGDGLRRRPVTLVEVSSGNELRTHRSEEAVRDPIEVDLVVVGALRDPPLHVDVAVPRHPTDWRDLRGAGRPYSRKRPKAPQQVVVHRSVRGGGVPGVLQIDPDEQDAVPVEARVERRKLAEAA